MNSPITGKRMLPFKDKQTLVHHGIKIEINYHFYKCMDSGETFRTDEFDQLNLNQVHRYIIN